MRQDQLVARPGHRDVAQPTLLRERPLRRHRLTAAETGRQRQRLAPAVPREATGDHAGHVDDREFQTFRLVDREDRDAVRLGVEVRRRRIVAGVDERLEVLGEEYGSVIRQHGRLRPDQVEEPRDVAQSLIGGGRVGHGEPGQQPAVAEEGIQHLAGRTLMGHRGVARHVADETGDRRPRLGCQPKQAGLSPELIHDRQH